MRFSFVNYLLVLLAVLLCKTGISQNGINYTEADQQTYASYLNKNWNELIKTGKLALKNDIDYYYLRMRMGIAYYEKGEYIKAQKHFEKALTFNSGDEVAQEYLYFCFVFTNRFEEARWVSKKFSAALKEKLNINKLSSFGYTFFEAARKTSDSSRLVGNGTYLQTGLGHYVANRFSLFHAVTYFRQPFSDGKRIDGTVTQVQYYIKPVIPLKHNWQLAPAFHFMDVIFNITKPSGPPPMPSLPGKPPPPKPGLIDSTSNTGKYALSLALRKMFTHFDFTASTTFSDVNGADQLQHGLSLAYIPFKNNAITLGCANYLHTESSYVKNYVVVNPYLTLSPGKRFSLTANYLTNNGGKNVVESNGYLINNTVDITTSRWGILASVGLSKHIDLYGMYQYENKKDEVENYNYHFKLILFGIKYKA